MKIIACIDDQNGLLFNHRRLSSDVMLTRRILENIGDATLWVTPYSAKLFDGASVCVDPLLMDKAKDADYCFIEDTDMAPYMDKVSQIILYRWNRRYPSDRKFPALSSEWRLIATEEFTGNSHPVITEEVYER